VRIAAAPPAPKIRSASRLLVAAIVAWFAQIPVLIGLLRRYLDDG
jgi:hypothetical protein